LVPWWCYKFMYFPVNIKTMFRNWSEKVLWSYKILKTKLSAHFLFLSSELAWNSVTACINSFYLSLSPGMPKCKCLLIELWSLMECKASRKRHSCLLLMFLCRIVIFMIRCYGMVPYCAFLVRPRAQLVFSVPLPNSKISYFLRHWLSHMSYT